MEANICGVTINLPQPLGADGSVIDDIIGCQIVRRSSKKIYQKTLLQVALARPVSQKTYINKIDNYSELWDNTDAKPDKEPKNSPYYPTGFLWTGYSRIYPGYM